MAIFDMPQGLSSMNVRQAIATAYCTLVQLTDIVGSRVTEDILI